MALLGRLQAAHWAIVALVGLLVAVVGLYLYTAKPIVGEKRGRLSQLGGEFTLQSVQGPVSLSDFRGRIVVLYFGYLSCPGICSNAMAVMATAMALLNDAQRDRVQILMVGLDPQRDPVEYLQQYASQFYPTIVALTAASAQLETVLQQYGIERSIRRLQGPIDAYDIEHSSRFYLVDAQGQLQDILRYSTTVNELVARLHQLTTL